VTIPGEKNTLLPILVELQTLSTKDKAGKISSSIPADLNKDESRVAISRQLMPIESDPKLLQSCY
jgi:hypothetical protein